MALPILTGCHQERQVSDVERSISVQQKTACDTVSLDRQAEKFLIDLRTKDLSKIASNYQGQTDSVESINYTFFPQRDENAIFDFPNWSLDRRLFAHILGEYESGKLVVFSNKQAKSYDSLIENGKKFESFFVCNFICEENGWRISAKHTCFEETGAPFEN